MFKNPFRSLSTVLVLCLFWITAFPCLAGDAKAPDDKATKAPDKAPLLAPKEATKRAPDQFRVLVETTKGNFRVDIHREWAPLGVDRFYNLVILGYFTDVAIYRMIPGFMAQFGFHGEPDVNRKWLKASLEDDPPKHSNTAGRLTFANRGPNTRTTQFFINMVNNDYLDRMGFVPFGEVVDDGLQVVTKFYGGYGDGAPYGRGPNQGRILSEGNSYLRKKFPELDYIKRISIVKGSEKKGGPGQAPAPK